MVITKKSPLSILRHLRVVNSEFLKQRFDGCLFQVSFYLYYIYIGIVTLNGLTKETFVRRNFVINLECSHKN